MATETITATQAAIVAYYDGERSEMWAIIAGSVLITALYGWLFLTKRDGFSMALLSVVIVFGLVFSGIAVSLLMRDTSAKEGLVASASSPASSALHDERQRIERVIGNYRYYRYGAAAFILIALMALTFGSQPWLHGLAVGFLAVALSQIAIDHYSERRALSYFSALEELKFESSAIGG
jgi:hypothetical protein